MCNLNAKSCNFVCNIYNNNEMERIYGNDN